jgi:uracil-DNA glycosylase family 4
MTGVVQDTSCTRCDLSKWATSVCIRGEQRAGLTDSIVPIERSDTGGITEPLGQAGNGSSNVTSGLAVPESGNNKTVRIMVLGEAPGFNEDQQGRPFVGASGQLLTEALTAAGITEYFVTNAVRCAPPENKLPAKSIKACAPYLDAEIAEYQPTHILALGNTALQRVMGGKGTITALAGKEQWSEKYQCHVMGAFHPAYILRAQGKRDAWMQDIHRFARLVSGGLVRDPPIAVHVVEGYKALQPVVDLLHTGLPFTFDFEATPIPWWHKDWKAYSVSFSWDGVRSVVVPLWHPESPLMAQDSWLRDFFADVKDVMQDPDVSKTAWNQIYDDIAWFRCSGYLPYTTCDAMVLRHVLDENMLKNLKWNGRALLGWPDWDIDATKEHPLDQLAFYNGADACATFLLREKLLAELEQQPELLRYFAHVEMPKLRALEKLIVNGIYVDPETLERNWAQCKINYTEAAAQIPVENPNSSQQIAAWLYGPTAQPVSVPDTKTASALGASEPAATCPPSGLGLPVPSLTPGGAPSTDESTINLLARQYPEYPILKKVLEARRWKKYDSTYFAYANELVTQSHDRRAHFDYRSTSVETGRLGSRFHTQPRDPFVRSIYSSPPGSTLLSVDYSQIEARLAAWKAAGCPATWEEVDPQWGRMLLAFHDKRDIYVETAAAALRKDSALVSRNERQMMGKVPSLAMIYKISAEGFREYAWSQFEIVYSRAEAEHLHRTFYSLWPEIPRWHDLEGRILRNRGYAVSPLGRIRRLPEAMSENRKLSEEAVRAGINAPVQSCASDILQTAMIMLQGYIEADEWDVKITGNVHDDLTFEVADDCLYDWAATAEHVMTVEVPARLKGLGLHLPPNLLAVEMQAGPWGQGSVLVLG